MSIDVRNFRPRDGYICAEIFARGWAHAFPHLPRVIDAQALADETREEHILVADDNGAILGFAGIYVPDNFLHHLYVDPRFHGRGAGRALVNASCAMLPGRLNLKCSVSNMPARAFYARLGFSEGDRGEDRFGAWVRLLAPNR